MAAAPTAVRSPTRNFGASLRWWRTTRRYSQLRLASEAGVSSRHLSYLETGKARPSREMVVHLSTVLDLALRDRNSLLDEAGFAPVYSHSQPGTATGVDAIRDVLRIILDGLVPNPAVAVDRCGDLIDANATALTLLGQIVAPDSPALSPVPNLNRLTLHPDGVRTRTENWDEVAANVMARLEREQAHRPADDALAAMVEEMRSFPDVDRLTRISRVPTGADLLAALRVRCFDGAELSMISTIATIGAPNDVTLDEIHLETFFPADDLTRATFERWLPSS